MSLSIEKPQPPQDGETAMLEIVPTSYGVVGPDSDWWVNEPAWEQAVRRLTAPPLPPPAATADRQRGDSPCSSRVLRR